jgi:hypothetical protein
MNRWKWMLGTALFFAITATPVHADSTSAPAATADIDARIDRLPGAKPDPTAGGCPQGTYLSCPNHEGGVEGPCQCKPRGPRPKHMPQTLVNNTAGVPPGRDRPAMIGSAPKAPQFPGCCSTCVQPENWCYSCTDNTGGGACAKGTIAAECKMLGSAIACDKK